MHWTICKELGIEEKKRWYEHEPKTVTENDSVTILWDMPIQTERNIAANRPDIVLKNKKDKTCLLIDMTTPLDTNTSGKTTEKRGWANVGAQNNNSPGCYGNTWHHQEGHGKLLQQNPWQINIHELQKITLLSTAHLLRRVLSIK